MLISWETNKIYPCAFTVTQYILFNKFPKHVNAFPGNASQTLD